MRNICLDSGAEKVAIPSVRFLLTAQSTTLLGHDERFVTSDSVSRKLLYEEGNLTSPSSAFQVVVTLFLS